MTLPTNRTQASTPAEHVNDHNVLHALHNVLEGSTVPSTVSAAQLAAKADDSAVVHDTGPETIDGVKTFLSSPIVPTATTSGQAINKAQMDSAILAGQSYQSFTIVELQPGWDPIAADNDAAFDSALAAALAAGGGPVLLPRLLKISTLHDVGAGVDLHGLGSRQTGGASEIRCGASAAGLRYGDLVTPQSGGISSRFRVNGNAVATAPFRIGLSVGRMFANIDIDGSAGTGLLLQGTGNCSFYEVNIQGSVTDACQVDRAAGNAFFKCEFGGSSRYQLALVSNGAALPFVTDYPQNNTFYACIFEYHDASTVAQVYQGAGINNMLSDCIIATSSTPTSSGLRLVKLEKAGSPFSTRLKLRDCQLGYNFTHASTVAVTIGDGTELILSGDTSLSNAGIGFRNDTTGLLDADRVTATSVTTLKSSVSGGDAGLASMRIRPDINDPFDAASLGSLTKVLPAYDASGVLIGYLPVYGTFA